MFYKKSFFLVIKWLLYSETTAAMEWSRKELSNLGIIIREKQTSLKMGFSCFAFQNHELCVFSVVLLAVFLRFRILNSTNNFISETRKSMFFYAFHPLRYAWLCYFRLFYEPSSHFSRYFFVSNDLSPPHSDFSHLAPKVLG